MKRCLVCHQPYDASGWVCPACGSVPAERNGFPAFAPELDGQSDGFNPAFFRLMVEVEPVHFWFLARNAILMDVRRCGWPCSQRDRQPHAPLQTLGKTRAPNFYATFTDADLATAPFPRRLA